MSKTKVVAKNETNFTVSNGLQPLSRRRLCSVVSHRLHKYYLIKYSEVQY